MKNITIGIIGLGRMGQAILGVLNSHPAARAESFYRLNGGETERLKTCDVVIEFTTPEAAPGIIETCLGAGISLVSGTTGWHESHLDRILRMARDHQSRFLYATNFSIGMNMVFAMNERLAAMASRFSIFRPSIREVHHVHKKDAPSGTAYTLIEGILRQQKGLHGFVLNPSASTEDTLPVYAWREGEVKGIHEVTWRSDGEEIRLYHEAHDRRIFAEGAVTAALWLCEKDPGVYTMRDVIGVH